MNLSFEEYLQDLGLENLAEMESLDALTSVALTVHKQFLLDLYDTVTEDSFNAIKTSIKLGPVMYMTTLKHLAPNYLEIYKKSKNKIFIKLKESA